MKGRTKAQGAQQEGAEEYILAREGEREWMLGRIALLGTLRIVLSRYYADDHVREGGWLWNVAGIREKTNSNRVLVGKPERKGPFGKPYVSEKDWKVSGGFI